MSNRQAELGELEQLTLLGVVRLGDGAYGASVRRELECTARRSVSIATIYVTLVRLEKKAYLESWQAAPEPKRGGKARRCYRITPAGARALRNVRATAQRMWDGLHEHPDLQ